jgi:hypothetical protein
MKRRLYCLLSTLLMMFIMSPLCYAQLTHVDGLACWDGDLDLPLVDAGSHAGTLVDVSSARIIRDNDQYIDTEADTYFVVYDSDSMKKEPPMVFRYYKKAGQVLVKFGTNDDGFHTGLRTYVNHCYYLIRTRLGI